MHLLVCALGLMTLVASNDIIAALAAGCGTPQFDGNPSNFAVGIAPHSMIAGDFNHDGLNDLAVANYGSGQGSPDGAISILLNNGSGGFSSANNITAGINPRSIVSADFNHDGHVDLAVLNYLNGMCCISSFATVLLGNGAGNFVASGSPLAVGNDAGALTTGDYNKDGKADLAATVLVSNSRSVSILLGDGNAGFSASVKYPAGGNATSIVTGDFNGDTKPDLVTSNVNGSNISVLLGDGLGAFGIPATYPVGGANPQFVAAADFNQDSKLDVVTANTANTVTVVLGNGDGSFAAGTQFTVAAAPLSVMARDVNGDGKPDIVTADDASSSASVLLGTGTGSFGSYASYTAGLGTFFVVGSDFNGDAKFDLAVANALSNNVTILRGDGSGRFAGARLFRVGEGPFAVVSGDFNRDGKADLATTNGSQNSISVLLGDGNGSFGADVKYFTTFGPRDLALADFNGDGKLDIAVGYGTCCQITTSIGILLGDGSGGFSSVTNFTGGTNALGIVSADFNKDGNPDVATANNETHDVSILLGGGNGSLSAPVSIDMGASPNSIATGDVNGDGNADLIVGGGPVSVLLGNGTGGFSPGTPVVLAGPISVAVGDVNGDGLADLATANSVGSLSVLLGNGSGSFGAPLNLTVASPHRVAIIDVNGDGKSDLAATSGSSNIVLFLGDGSGAFDAGTTFNGGSGPGGILPTDLNQDGRTDVVVTNASGFLAVFLNTCQAAPVVPPGLYVGDAIVAEGNSGQTNTEFEIFLPVSSDKTVTVSYYSSNQSATGGVDYQSVSGRVTFPPGVTEQTIVVPVNGDTLTEPEERFNVSLFDPLNAVLAHPNGLGIITNDDGPAVVVFAPATYTAPEGVGSMDITVMRSGNLSLAFSVAYVTSDAAGSNACNFNNGAASSRCDYLTTVGTLHFAANETTKTISVPIIDDAYAEGIVNETFSLTLSDPSGATLGANSIASVAIADNDSSNGDNPIAVSSFFVRQHYIDFLNREPDLAGLFFWTDQIENCTPKPQCTEIRRINVSAAFFLSIEFQETGYLVYRFYKSAYGNLSGTPVPLRFVSEFLPDTQQIGKGVVIGQPGADQQLEANKVAYALDFVSRSRFTSAYPTTLTPAQFVDALFVNAVVTPSATDRNAAINEFAGAGNTADVAARARALRRVAENSTLKQQESTKAFVLMQYFGYLRRNPNDPPEAGLNFDGYNFWLGKLNEFNGNFVNAEMVKAFIISGEYRHRFGQ